jgi:uncharacterized protein YqgV (UPF0045/DUF77 family)
VAYVEFTIEPFVEGRPGPHVTAAIAAAESNGAEVDVGPFGSSCTVDVQAVGDLVGTVTAAAFEHGATHVSVHVAREQPADASAYERPRPASERRP